MTANDQRRSEISLKSCREVTCRHTVQNKTSADDVRNQDVISVRMSFLLTIDTAEQSGGHIIAVSLTGACSWIGRAAAGGLHVVQELAIAVLTVGAALIAGIVSCTGC